MPTCVATIITIKNTFLEFVSPAEDASCGSALRRTKSSPCLISNSEDACAGVAAAAADDDSSRPDTHECDTESVQTAPSDDSRTTDAEDDKAWDEASTEAGDCSPSSTTEAGDCSPPRPPRLRAIEAEDQGAAAAAPAASQPTEVPSPALSEEALMEQGLIRLLVQMCSMAPAAASARRSPFECKFPPAISVPNYVARVLRMSRCSPGCVVVSLVYLDRLIKRHRWISVSPLTCHRLMLTSVVVAIKFYDDTYYSNKFYSQVGGVEVTQLNSLEMKFLGLVDFQLRVDPAEYELYRNVLQKAVGIGRVA